MEFCKIVVSISIVTTYDMLRCVVSDRHDLSIRKLYANQEKGGRLCVSDCRLLYVDCCRGVRGRSHIMNYMGTAHSHAPVPSGSQTWERL